MKEQIIHLKGISKRVAMLLLLVAGTLFLISQTDRTYAAVDCFSNCDDQYHACISTCCSTSCDWDYATCSSTCFGNEGGGNCPHQTQCQNIAGRQYAQCMANQLGGHCLNPDGTVNAPCCFNDSVQEYTGCCYP